jgi:hypothetical protein
VKPFAAVLVSFLAAVSLVACGSDDGGNVTASASASGSGSVAPSKDCNIVDGTDPSGTARCTSGSTSGR